MARFKERHGMNHLREMSKKSYYKHQTEIRARRNATHAQRTKEEKLLRKPRMSKANGISTAEKLVQKLQYYGYRCRYCRIELTDVNRTFDHAISRHKGGSNWVANMLPCCILCNCRKGRRTIFEFLGKVA